MTRDVVQVVAELRKLGSKKHRDGYARYGIPADRAFGIPMGTIQALAKKLGKDHALAAELWQTGWYEARLLCAYLDDPAQVSAAQMDAWCREFDSWAIVDTICFALFDKTPHAWRKVAQWVKKCGEFQRRAGFALLASLVVHDKKAPDEPYLRGLELIRIGAADERNFVKKAVNWSLGCIGKRNLRLNAAALALARELAASEVPHTRWIGKDAVRELSDPKLNKRLAA